MPYTFNGCGTTYYGRRDLAADGSYVTTMWVTLIWIPLLPLRSYRVLPVGKGTNIVIHSSQSYRVVRVSLCWPQVRNVYLCGSPVLLLFLYFSWPDIRQWLTQDVSKPAISQSALRPEVQAVPVEADLPLDSKDAALACGKVLKLGERSFTKLDLPNRLSQLIQDSGFTDEEIKELGTEEDLQNQAFSAYSLAYLTWDKPAQMSRGKFDGIVIKAAQAADKEDLSPSDRAKVNAYLVKLKKMMLKAFDMGRSDAKTSPCPFPDSR